MDSRFLHGLETEYAFSQFTEDGEALQRRAGVQSLFRAARKGLECLPDAASSGLFLGNGSRFYLDAGYHPELATPECTDPWQLVRYLKAGEEILIDLASELDTPRAGRPRTRTSFFRANVDYSSRATWGCHESYQYRHAGAEMSGQLIPHLVSRIVYTGAGGFDARAPGLEFLLSPRVSHLEHASSADSTGSRGIFHTRDEPLCGGDWHRLHLLCGESLCGEVGSFLKVATTALIVRLIEHGACDSSAVEPYTPLAAMKTFAADPGCTRSVAVAGHGRITAIGIQRHYLAAVEASLDEPYMPDWALDVCRLWGATLDRLEAGEGIDGDAAYVFDWAIKRQLYASHAEQRGFGEEDVARHNRVSRAVAKVLGVNHEKLEALPTVAKSHALARQVEPVLAQHQVPLDEFQAFLLLRAELCEIDTRFGELGERGIHSLLERSGTITPRLDQAGNAWLWEGIPGVENVALAKTEPPAEGRAHFRGSEIRRCAASGATFAADWQVILDREQDRIYDLSDPFGEGAAWRPPTEESRPWQMVRERMRRARP